MTLGHARLPAWLVALGALLAGCTGPQLLNLNTDLVRLQEQKSTLEKQARGSAGTRRRSSLLISTASWSGYSKPRRARHGRYSTPRRKSPTTGSLPPPGGNGPTCVLWLWRRRALSGAIGATALTWRRAIARCCSSFPISWSMTCGPQNSARWSPRRGRPDFPAAWPQNIGALPKTSSCPIEVLSRRNHGRRYRPSSLFLGVMRARRAAIARNLNQVLNLFVTRRVTQADTNAVASICADIRNNAPTILPRRCKSF